MNAANGTRAPFNERLQSIELRALRKKPVISALAALLSLAACGGDDGTGPIGNAPQPAPSPSPSPSPTPTPTPASSCIRLSQFDSDCTNTQVIPNVVSIQASRETCIAPCGVFFEVARNQSLGTARPIHELSYQWSFDDASARFEALPDDFPDSFKDANAAQGPLAGHVFEQPGTYEVRVWVANRNQDYATDTITITVEDPDTAYAGDRTICHSNSGNFSGCPSGAQRFTSAVSALGAANQDRMRVLFRSGEDTLLNADTTFRGLRDIQVGPFGSGQKPILRVNSTVDKTLFTPRETDGFTIFGLDMRGDYDPRTGLGENFDENGIGNLGNIRNTTVFRNRFSGLGMAMVFIERPVGVIVADNEITDWYDYGTYNASANQTAYVGNSIKQNPNAVSGTGGTNRGSIPRWADHGPNRTAEVISLVVAQNDIFSNTGWSSSGQAHQPTIRYNQSGSRGHFGVINRNRLEGGATVVSISTESNSVGADVGNLIFERNLLIGTDNTAEFFALTFGGTTIRNNIAIMPDVVNTFNSFWTFAGYQARPTTDANAREPVVIAGNAIIQLQSRSPQEFQILRGFQNWANANYRTTNNLVYAPNIPNSSAFTNYTPLDQNEKYRPLAGSSAIGAATPDDLVFDTLDGRIRPAAPSVGALEP